MAVVAVLACVMVIVAVAIPMARSVRRTSSGDTGSPAQIEELRRIHAAITLFAKQNDDLYPIPGFIEPFSRGPPGKRPADWKHTTRR